MSKKWTAPVGVIGAQIIEDCQTDIPGPGCARAPLFARRKAAGTGMMPVALDEPNSPSLRLQRGPPVHFGIKRKYRTGHAVEAEFG